MTMHVSVAPVREPKISHTQMAVMVDTLFEDVYSARWPEVRILAATIVYHGTTPSRFADIGEVRDAVSAHMRSEVSWLIRLPGTNMGVMRDFIAEHTNPIGLTP